MSPARSGLRRLPWWLVLVGSATPVSAHTMSPGIASASAAFAHMLLEPPAPLALLGLGLLIGACGAQVIQWTWLALAVAMPAGLAAATTLRLPFDPEMPLVLVAAVTGLITASGSGCRPAVALMIGLAAGFFLGVFGAPAPASWITTGYFVTGSLLGANFALVFVAASIATIRERLDSRATEIGLRVAGAWIAAIALLMLAVAIKR